MKKICIEEDGNQGIGTGHETTEDTTVKRKTKTTSLYERIMTVWNYTESPKEVGHVRESRLDLLKWIGIITMLIDHVGYIFFPGEEAFRAIGRLAFPIFAYLLAEGFSRTRNVNRYLIRIWLFALLSQVPYMILFDTTSLNILFTLFAGLLFIRLGPMYIGLLLYIAWVVPFDYGVWGLLLPYLFHVLKKNKLIAVLLISISVYFRSEYVEWPIQNFGMIAVWLCLFLPNIKLVTPKTNRWFFYLFYPGHLTIIAVIYYGFYI